MLPKLVVTDWLFGYDSPDQIEGVSVAFSTPHYLMWIPRNTELSNTQMSYITRSKNFTSMEEMNAFIGTIMMDPRKMFQALDEANLSKTEKDHLIYLELIEQAYRSYGERAMRMILQSLLYTNQPIDAYLWIANHLSKTPEEVHQLLSLAVATAEVTIDKKKKKSEMGHLWNWNETRPYLRAKASLAEHLDRYSLYPDETLQAVEIMENLLKLDLQDHMGIRFLLMSMYSNLGFYDKMESLYRSFPIDHQNPLFLYPMAYKNYITLGPAHESTQSLLLQAIQSNHFVASLLLDNEEIPFFNGPSYRKHSLEEAHYFLFINIDYFEPEDKMMDWLQDSFKEYTLKPGPYQDNKP